MHLSARILENVSGVNSFDYANQATFTEGDTPTIYFQLVDLAKNKASEGFVPAGCRYVPEADATLTITLDHVDSARKITRAATQPFANDPSIWSFVILTTDKLRGTVNMKLALSEDGKVTNGLKQAALGVETLDGLSRV
jgi:hypothetical protein